MARTDDLPLVALSKDEQELVAHAIKDDWFILDGWKRYGTRWIDHVPTAINVGLRYFFDLILLPHQLAYYYCPITDIIIHGGRYSGKTIAIACANAFWVATHPGNNWLHTSPSLEQAKLSFSTILSKDYKNRFSRAFVAHTRTMPAPDILFKRMDENDPGSIAQFRSIGQKPAELLRGIEAGRITADEPFRTQLSDAAYRVIVGSARGPNQWMLNSHPDLKEEYDRLAHVYSLELDVARREELREELDAFAERHGLSKQTRFAMYGNVGAAHWEWERFQFGTRNPGRRWAVTWTSDMNPYVPKKQFELIKLQFRNDPQGLKVETEAQRPIAVGEVFPNLDTFFDGELDAEVLKAIRDGKDGYTYDVDENYGLVRYRKPAQPGYVFAFGSDPGTGRIPKRNKWVILGACLNTRPFEIVYIDCGNFTYAQQGDINWWIVAAKRALQLYPMPEGHFAAEAGATQKNVHQVVWPDNLVITPLVMNTIKATLVMQAQLMIGRNMIVSPGCGLFESEMLSYKLDDKKIDQDFVMAFLSLVSVLWPYVADEFTLPGEEEDEDLDYWEVTGTGRDVRDSGRLIRSR